MFYVGARRSEEEEARRCTLHRRTQCSNHVQSWAAKSTWWWSRRLHSCVACVACDQRLQTGSHLRTLVRGMMQWCVPNIKPPGVGRTPKGLFFIQQSQTAVPPPRLAEDSSRTVHKAVVDADYLCQVPPRSLGWRVSAELHGLGRWPRRLVSNYNLSKISAVVATCGKSRSP